MPVGNLHGTHEHTKESMIQCKVSVFDFDFFPAQWSQNREKCVWSLTSFQETKESSPWEKEKQFRYQQSDSSDFSVPTHICFVNCLHICFICAYSCWTSPSSGGKWGMTEGRKALSPVISWAIMITNLMKRLPLSRHEHVTVHIKDTQTLNYSERRW